MRMQTIKKSVMWLGKSFIITTLFVISFSFLATEWNTILHAGRAVFEVAKPFGTKIIDEINITSPVHRGYKCL